MECIHLLETFGRRYRVAFEPPYSAKRRRHESLDPWAMILPCRHGHICPWGGQLLAACTDNRGTVASRLAALPFTQVRQDGDDGINVTFHVRHFEQIAAIMKPRKRRTRVLTEQQRRELADRGRSALKKLRADQRSRTVSAT